MHMYLQILFQNDWQAYTFRKDLLSFSRHMSYMYYLKHEHECFIRYKMRGAAERFIADKAQIASVFK